MAKPAKQPKQAQPASTKAFDGDLLSRFGWVLLLVLPFAVYGVTLSFGITQLDDYIFIFSKDDFNRRFANIVKIFSVGVFSEKDIYYRPLFLATFIIERLFVDLENVQAALRLYHFTNIVLHAGCVLLLHQLLKRLGVTPKGALLLALLFAVHPALTMAVAWIPGRNDTMLTLFSLAFFIRLHKYIGSKSLINLALQALFLAMALFTKEAAVFIPFVAVLFLWAHRENLLDRKYLTLFATWLALGLLWFVLRSNVLDQTQDQRQPGEVASDAFERLPAYLVYIGKAIVPVNLSVFPSLEQSQPAYGLVGLAFIGLVVWLTHRASQRNSSSQKASDQKRMWLLGAGWFVLFIAPFILVPPNVNDQVFEHRLYLPMCGLMILLGHTFLFNGGVKFGYVASGSALVAVVFIVTMHNYLPLFEKQIPFWENAVQSSPNSSYAHKLMGARYNEANMKEKALPHFKQAYALNKKEKHARYFIVRDELVPAGKTDSAMKLLYEEIDINPTYTEAYFELSHLYFVQNRLDSTLKYLVLTRQRQPLDQTVNTNLLFTYIKMNDYKSAAEQAAYMRQNGLVVDSKIETQIEALRR